MTDDELADYLGIPAEHPMKATVIKSLSPAKRATYERMKLIEIEVALWAEGLGQKPSGVLIDTERSTRRRRAWK